MGDNKDLVVSCNISFLLVFISSALLSGPIQWVIRVEHRPKFANRQQKTTNVGQFTDRLQKTTKVGHRLHSLLIDYKRLQKLDIDYTVY